MFIRKFIQLLINAIYATKLDNFFYKQLLFPYKNFNSLVKKTNHIFKNLKRNMQNPESQQNDTKDSIRTMLCDNRSIPEVLTKAEAQITLPRYY